MKCPCHSGKDYDKCCRPYHEGALPSSALELMRSRYSAFALNDAEYIIKTTHHEHPDSRLPFEKRKKQIINFSKNTEFIGLEIKDFYEKDKEAVVIFRAILLQSGKDVSFTEKSFFLKAGKKWLYRSGVIDN